MTVPTATPELDSEEQRGFTVPTGPTAHRTLQSLSALLVALAVFEGALFVPGVASLLGVDAFDGAIACGLVIVGSAFATASFWISGLSRLYLWADYTESLLTAAGYSYLIYASQSAQSFFWLLYLAHVFVMGTGGTTRRNAVLLGVAPAIIALAFGLKGEFASVVVSVVAGTLGIALHFMVGRSSDELEAVRRREAALKGSVARLRVMQERNRIARDLHDGVGAQLAGLIWRVRRLATEPSNPPTRAEVESLERRVLDTVDEVRNVVLALRREPMDWQEATLLMTNRCQEICGSISFELRAEGTPDQATLDVIFSDLAGIVFELVRNASRHALANRITVQIEAGTELRLRVTDDGRGLHGVTPETSQGGLRNVRERASYLGGRIAVTSNARGTRIEVTLPVGGNHSVENPIGSAKDDSQALAVPASHAALRTFNGLFPVFVAVAAFQAAFLFPSVTRLLGVGLKDAAIASGLVFVGTTVATTAYRVSGPSQLYLWCEFGESVLAAAGYSHLIHTSGTPHSAFWFFYFFHCFGLATGGTNFRNSLLLGGAPAAIALRFSMDGRIAAGVTSLVAGAFGLMLYLMVAKAFDELEAARRNEAKLRADLAELSVARERDRIARDLHDTIGTQLSDLASKVRGFTSLKEVEALEQRVLETVEELRSVVLALRREQASAEKPLDVA